MLKNLPILLLLSVSCLNLTAVQAQIVPDNSLGIERSQLTPVNSTKNRIEGGALRGQLLFHSFQDFNVGTGQSIYFGDRANVRAIFSRVTGTNPSVILGQLGVEGNANLFFINPNGILFGSGASLDIRGAFIGTTADRIRFPDGSIFSATEPQPIPLLTIDTPTPLGLEFVGSDRGSIVNVTPLNTDRSLTLVGGTIASSENIISLNGDVSLVTVPQLSNSVVRLDENGSYLERQNLGLNPSQNVLNASQLSLSQLVSLADRGFAINLQNQINPSDSDAIVQVGDIVFSGSSLATGIDIDAGNSGSGGKVSLDASHNIQILSTIPDRSINLISRSLQPSDINLKAGGNINLDRALVIIENSDGDLPSATDSGNILLTSGNNITLNQSNISNDTFTGFSAGNINLNAGNNIELTGNSAVQTTSNFNSSGNAGNINFSGNNVRLATSQVRTTSSIFGAGNAGSIRIAALDAIALNNSTIQNTVSFGSTGDIGNIYLSGNNLTLNNQSAIGNLFDSATAGNGGLIDLKFHQISLFSNSTLAHNTSPLSTRGGEINIASQNLFLQDNSQIFNINSGRGENGKLTINVGGDLRLDNNSSISHDRFILSPELLVFSSSGADVKIAARRIELHNNSEISNRSLREHETQPSDRLYAAGNLEISTNSLELFGNSQINADALGNSISAGKIDIDSSQRIKLDFSTIGSNISAESRGNPGEIAIATPKLTLNSSQIVAEVESGALAGIPSQIKIEAPHIELSQSQISTGVAPTAIGNGGNIEIQTDTLKLDRQSEITATTNGKGNGGDISLVAPNAIILHNGSSIRSEVAQGAEGNGGKIAIASGELKLENDSSITTNSLGEATSNAGTIEITASRVNLSGNSQLTATTSAGVGGSISITGDSLTAVEGSQVSTSTASQSPAGNILVDLTGNLDLSGTNTGLFANTDLFSSGMGGDIFVKASGLQITDSAGLFVNSRGNGRGGNIQVIGDRLLLDRGQISGETANNTGGNVKIEVGGILELRNGSRISTSAGVNGLRGDGGNIDIRAGFALAVPSENSDITANAFLGNGGTIGISATGLLGIEVRSNLTNFSDITASSAFGLPGIIGLETFDDPSKALENLSVVTAIPEVIQGCQQGSDRPQARFYRLGSHSLSGNLDYLDDGQTPQWVSWVNTPFNVNLLQENRNIKPRVTVDLNRPCSPSPL